MPLQSHFPASLLCFVCLTLGCGRVLVLHSPPPPVPGRYYVDCQAPDGGTGESASSPWNSLAAVSAFTGEGTGFSPGDVIALKLGTTCVGAATAGAALHPLGSGSPGTPITLTSYGDGSSSALPIIDANQAYVGIELDDQHDWTIENLEVEGAVFRNVWVTAEQVGVFSNFSLQNLVVHDNNVTSLNLAKHTAFMGAGGIIVEPCAIGTVLDHITLTGVTSYFNHSAGIQIGHDHRDAYFPNAPTGAYEGLPDCPMSNPDTAGEQVTHIVVSGSESYANDSAGLHIAYAGSPSVPESIVISNNDFHHNGGIQTFAERYGSYTTPNINGEGAWWSSSCNVVASGNQSAFNKRGTTGDGGGLDADNGTVGNLIERNWLHDNDGYGVTVISVYAGTAATHTTIRYNMMANNGNNDGVPDNGGDIAVQSQPGAGIEVDGVYIYNNTLLRSTEGPGLLSHADFTGGSQNFFVNNIIYRDVSSGENAQMEFFAFRDEGAHTGISTGNNLYFNAGSVAPTASWMGSTLPMTPFGTFQTQCSCEASSQYVDPHVLAPDWDQSSWPTPASFGIAADSPAIGAGQVIEASMDPNGAPTVDFFGTPLSGTPTIGAFQ